METKIEKLPKSRVRLTITVPAAKIAEHYDAAVKKVSEHVEIKGFRKGHAPKNLVIQKAGNGTVLNEMLDLILPDTYYGALADHKELIPVAQPAVDVKKMEGLTDDNLIPTEIVYTAEVDVMPEVKLGDYNKIRVRPKKIDTKIDKKEIDGTIDELKKLYGEEEWLKVGQFKDEEEARKAVEENIRQQKFFQAQSDTYDMIIEEALKKAKLEVPESFVHNEIHRMERQVEMQAKAYGMTFDDWLANEKMSHEDFHTKYHEQAEKAAKVGMILGRIAEEEGIDPSSNDASRLVLEKLYTTAVSEKDRAALEPKTEEKTS